MKIPPSVEYHEHGSSDYMAVVRVYSSNQTQKLDPSFSLSSTFATRSCQKVPLKIPDSIVVNVIYFEWSEIFKRVAASHLIVLI